MSTVADFTIADDSPPHDGRGIPGPPGQRRPPRADPGPGQGDGNDGKEPVSFADRSLGRLSPASSGSREQPQPRGEVVCGEAGFRLKGTKESLVGIDVALVSHELVARTPEERDLVRRSRRSWRSRSSRRASSTRTLVDTVAIYLEVGTVVWLIDPDFQTLTVCRPGENPRTFNIDDELQAEPYLSGFRIRIAELLG